MPARSTPAQPQSQSAEPEEILERTLSKIEDQRENWIIENQHLPNDTRLFLRKVNQAVRAQMKPSEQPSNPTILENLNHYQQLKKLHLLSIFLGIRTFLQLNRNLHQAGVEFGKESIVNSVENEDRQNVLRQRFKIAWTVSVFKRIYGPIRRSVLKYLFHEDT